MNWETSEPEARRSAGGASIEVTRLLREWSRGDDDAAEQLLPVIYRELHDLACAYFKHENTGHTLQATALVNEAYLRLVGRGAVEWQDRAHFYRAAAKTMRRFLVDHARRRRADKRGGGANQLGPPRATAMRSGEEMLALDLALSRLARRDPQQAKVVELRYFTGLTIRETADVLAISPATVKREWAMARAWLFQEIAGAEPKRSR